MAIELKTPESPEEGTQISVATSNLVPGDPIVLTEESLTPVGSPIPTAEHEE